IADWTKAIELSTNYAQAYCNRGFAYAQRGDFKVAIADGEKFLELAPNHPQAEQMRKAIEEMKKQIK
ncbi:MAG: tetratricopeptide repeat protein, partial [Planctomycetota bacterium]